MSTATFGYEARFETVPPNEQRRFGIHAAAKLFPIVEGIERDRLCDSLRERFDPLHPIVVWTKTGEIADGRTRRDLCVELERDALVAFVDFPDEAAVVRYVVAQNLARRHMSSTDLAKVAAKLAKDHGLSLRAAAQQTGASKSAIDRAVVRERTSVVPAGTTDEPAFVTGTDGKRYAKTKPPKLKVVPTPAKQETPKDRLQAGVKCLGDFDKAYDALRETWVGCTVKGVASDGRSRTLKVAGVRYDKHGRAYVIGGNGDTQARTLFVDEIVSVTKLPPADGEATA